jgi:hypothetical protein
MIVSCSKGEIILVGKSVPSIANCKPRLLLVPSRYAPEVVDGVKKMAVKSDDYITRLNADVVCRSLRLHT